MTTRKICQHAITPSLEVQNTHENLLIRFRNIPKKVLLLSYNKVLRVSSSLLAIILNSFGSFWILATWWSRYNSGYFPFFFFMLLSLSFFLCFLSRLLGNDRILCHFFPLSPSVITGCSILLFVLLYPLSMLLSSTLSVSPLSCFLFLKYSRLCWCDA